jgi:hypothetical protein
MTLGDGYSLSSILFSGIHTEEPENLNEERTGRMKKYLMFAFACLISALIAGFTGCGGTDSPEKLTAAVDKIEDPGDREKVVGALDEFFVSEAVQVFFSDSYGFAIFPTIGKGGLGIGGAHGAGWIFRQGDLTGISKMTQVTVGFQAGGQAFSQIIFFEDEGSYTDFTSGNFEFGAQASAVAITAGASASADTAGGSSAGAGSAQSKNNYTNGMAIFTHAKGGLMYEAAIGGQKFSFDEF